MALNFDQAWKLAWEDHFLRAYREDAPEQEACGSMSYHPTDGKVWIASYDEFGRVEYRQKFSRERYARAKQFAEKRYIGDDDVEWTDEGNV